MVDSKYQFIQSVLSNTLITINPELHGKQKALRTGYSGSIEFIFIDHRWTLYADEIGWDNYIGLFGRNADKIDIVEGYNDFDLDTFITDIEIKVGDREFSFVLGCSSEQFDDCIDDIKPVNYEYSDVGWNRYNKSNQAGH